ncbi:MAG: hypothetical protein Q4B65_02125 [Candidatus Saccharibacteria bacterium]|nr:hypothetical protein [Candidatus Saccharibacteria bacterium]
MTRKITRKQKIGVLIVALVGMILGGVLFIGATAGWFSGSKVTLDAEYYCEGECSGEMIPITGEEYEELISAKRSFVLFVDQGGCNTADRVRGFVSRYIDAEDMRVYTMMFSEMKETSLYPTVKYYPSVVIFSKGKVIASLRADSDEDAIVYNDEGAFVEWMGKYLER